MEDYARMTLNLVNHSLQLFRSLGSLCDTVEKWKRFPDRKKGRCRHCGNASLIQVRSDLFGFADVLAIRPLFPAEIILIQVTDRTNHSKRREKILSTAEAKLCALGGIRILVQSWKKINNRWQPKDEWLSLDQFPVELPTTAEAFYEMERKRKLPEFPPGTAIFHQPIKDSEIPF